MFDSLVKLVREIYETDQFVPLHEPCFYGREKQYLAETIDSTFVSSVGEFVDKFEASVAEFTGAGFAIATMNGTAALHTALVLAGVRPGDEVITQSFTFVATCNAIRYCQASPVFADVDRETLGLSPQSMAAFLDEFCEVRDDGNCWNKHSGSIVRACVPMHSFGFPVELAEISRLCNEYNILMLEDAAESLGSFYGDRHTGTASSIASLSFNGNKVITSGGGGMILTSDPTLAKQAKHLTTTAKVDHEWAYSHDQVGYNYRLPNLNAALGLAQMESLPKLLQSKRAVAQRYQEWGRDNEVRIVKESPNARANYWLNAIVTENIGQRDGMLEYTNKNGIMTRPAWTPMHQLSMYSHFQKTNLSNTDWLHQRVVNVPSSAKLNECT